MTCGNLGKPKMEKAAALYRLSPAASIDSFFRSKSLLTENSRSKDFLSLRSKVR
jgi:hypothetical protein